MLAPRGVEESQAEPLVLDELGEVLGGEGEDGARWRHPVGVAEGHHVADHGLGAALARVVLELVSVLEDDEGRVGLNEVLLSELNLLGDIDLGKMNAMFLELCGCPGEVCESGRRSMNLFYITIFEDKIQQKQFLRNDSV